MLIINKTLKITIVALLGLFSLYNGISFVATFIKAASQSYLLSGGQEFYFMGYYMMSAAHAGLCIVTIAAIIVIKKLWRSFLSKDLNRTE